MDAKSFRWSIINRCRERQRAVSSLISYECLHCVICISFAISSNANRCRSLGRSSRITYKRPRVLYGSFALDNNGDTTESSEEPIPNKLLAIYHAGNQIAYTFICDHNIRHVRSYSHVHTRTHKQAKSIECCFLLMLYLWKQSIRDLNWIICGAYK